MNCLQRYFEEGNKIVQELKKLVGNDNVLHSSVLLSAVEITAESKVVFNTKFLKYYKTIHPRSGELDIATDKTNVAKTIAKALLDYYYYEHPSVDSTVRNLNNNDAVIKFGYNNIFDREKGKSHIATMILDSFNNIQNNNLDLPKDPLKHYRVEAKKKWLDFILTTVAERNGLNKEDLFNTYKQTTDKAGYIDSLLGGTNKSITDKNLYAVYQELFSSDVTANDYLNEVFSDNKLQDVRHQLKDELEEETLRLAANASADENGTNTESTSVTDDIELDTTIMALNNHIGVYTSFMTHVGPRIKNYFNTLRKHNAPILGSIDTNNSFGIAETMDANACSSILYNLGDFRTIDSMIARIKHIAKTVKGFEAFIQLAEDLSNNLDFATEFRTVFAKTKMSKLETVIENGKAVSKVSNERANADSAMLYDLFNDLKGSIANDPSYYLTESIQKLTSTLNALNQLNKVDAFRINNLLDETINLLKTYCPSLQTEAIENYVTFNNINAIEDVTKRQLSNIRLLIQNLSDLNAKSRDAFALYQNMKQTVVEIEEHNKALNARLANHGWVDASEYRDIAEAYTDDYIQPLYEAAINLRNKLLPYSVVQTQLNSRNVHGNNNSDVINNSMVTFLYNMLNDFYQENIIVDDKVIGTRWRNKTLETWGLKKLRSKQYKYSSILLEQYDENGKAINKALFRYNNGQLVLTGDAHEILTFHLFNGSSNRDNSTNALFSEMATGTYLPTSFINFFKTQSRTTNTPLANYFLRTPSDAPKNFTLQAPRYNTSNLFLLKDSAKFENNLKEIVESSIKLVDVNVYKEKYYPNKDENNFSTINSARLHEYLLPTGNLLINNMASVKQITEPDDNGNYEAYVNYADKTRGFIFALRGTVEKAGKGHKLTNIKVEAIANMNAITKEKFDTLPDEIYGLYYSHYQTLLRKQDVTIGDKTWTKPEEYVNTKAEVYTLLRNQFKQEILNGCIALSKYVRFVKNKDGYYSVILDNNTPRFIKENLNKGFNYYHKGKNGKVFSGSNTTGYKLEGAVFHSQRFTLETTENGQVKQKNYFEPLISSDVTGRDDGTINFLYGGAMRIVATENPDGTIEVEDVIFSDNQNAKIDEALSSYLTDYKQQSLSRIEPYKDFILDVPVTDENVVDYSVNQLLTHFVFDDLLDGDTKFYKDPQTVLKRVKQSQGSGVPYGIADYSENSVDDLTELETSFLNNGTIVENEKETVKQQGREIIRNKRDDKGNFVTKETRIQDLFKGTILDGVKQRRGFRAVTIHNTQTTNVAALNQLIDKLVKDCGVKRSDAETLLFGPLVKDKKTGKETRRGGFTDTKVNDAQSYITVQEWVRRIAARGQLQRYLPLIKRLLAAEADPTIKLTASEIKEFIQVQKNFYFDLHYDDFFGIEAPRQIKNAEFVLIPSLIKGTQLEVVYNLMKEGKIDQLNTIETSKASNAEVLTIWDNNGNIPSLEGLSEDKFNKALVDKANELNNAAQIYSYTHLYTQQETPQHMNSLNKAGIQIIKKIIDNLPNDYSYLGQLKQQYFKLFSRNIQESYIDLLNELEIPHNNGKIILTDDKNIKDLNVRVLYNKLKEELIRTGIDSNLLDYVTLSKEDNTPLMPSYMNNVLPKFESIVQSLFNSAITRQKLPGFHAAQVTNVGWKPLNNKIDGVSYDKKLQYHPDGKSYIEVMVPASFLGIDKNSEHYKNKTNEEIIKELQDAKLDMIIGYRIPTEGKQSVCNMKVVGLIDDAYGSTIIVPDDWVSQTGSDFDIDSVYTIQPETYKLSSGEVKKIVYKEAEDRTLYDWFDYIKHFGEKALDPNVKGSIKAAQSSIQAEFDKIYEILQEKENEISNQFSNNLKTVFEKVHDSIIKSVKSLDLGSKDAYIERINRINRALIQYRTKVKNNGLAEKDNIFINQFIETTNDIKAFLEEQHDKYSVAFKSAIDTILNERMDTFNAIAKNNGLLTYDEYLLAENDLVANSRAARNTQLLEIMVNILSDDATLEENLSRSNFDDLIAARNELMNENVKNARDARSPYNVYDQIAYQEEAMSGAKLKAFSVTLDTFCSVCNTVKPTLEEPIYVIYDTKDFENSQEVLSRFTTDKLKEKEKTFSIRHNTYGWSKDNRSVSGKILTAYSSQTTAYILDNIKEGSLPNLNDYTFATFKTLLNIGLDYTTAVGFLMQPGITEIVKAYNTKKSIFTNVTGNPIHAAIRSVAKKLGVDSSDNVGITQVLASLNKRYGKAFNKIFGQKDLEITLDKAYLQNLPLIVSKLKNRLHNYSPVKESVDDLLFDLGTILSFYKISEIANTIGDIARCCNPDKFGAKQTVYATRKVFEDIDKSLFEYNVVPTFNEDNNTPGKVSYKTPRRPVLSVNNTHILNAIYPGFNDDTKSVDDNINDLVSSDIQKSAYPTLYAFLKYASATSTVIAKTVFDTQDSAFVNLIKGISRVANGFNYELSETTYNDVQKYVLSSIYQNINSVKYPIKVRLVNGNIELSQDISPDYKVKEAEAKQELLRIYGYERPHNIANFVTVIKNDRKVLQEEEFIVDDVNNPTKEELEAFENLSPAQKIQWIKTTFSNPGLFNLINVSLYNGNNRGRFVGAQTIEFREQNLNPNIVYAEFKKVFFNNNPFLVSAAIDIVKYAIYVEGLRMSSTAVNKVIDNDCLINEFGSNGLGFVDDLRKAMSEIKSTKGNFSMINEVNDLYENYLRSHPDFPGISTFNMTRYNKVKYNFLKISHGIFALSPEIDESTGVPRLKEFNASLEKIGIKYHLPVSDTYGTNKYIRILEDRVNRLYKIVPINNSIILYPLGNLNANENSEWSANESNNAHILSKRAYEYIIQEYIKNQEQQILNHEFIKEKIQEAKEQGDNFYYEYRKDRKGLDVKADDFVLEDAMNEEEGLRIAYNTIKTHFSNPHADKLYINNLALYKHIFSPGYENGSTQYITFDDNQGSQIRKPFRLFIPSNIKGFEKFYLNPLNGNERGDTSHIQNKSIKKIIEDAQEINQKAFSGLIEVQPIKESHESFAATLEELNYDALDFAEARMKANNDKRGVTYVQGLRSKGIDNTLEVLKNNETVVTRETAKYAVATAEYIKTNFFDQFIEDPTRPNTFIPITDDRVIGMIKTNVDLMNKYMEAVNIAQAFVNKFNGYVGFNVESEDTDIKYYINDIISAVKLVQDLPINDTLNRGMKAIIDSQSTNPMVKEGLLDVMDAWWKTYGITWQVHDIMENGTPILQVILKDVMGDIDAKRKHYKHKVKKEYWAKIKDIQKRAAELGNPIRMDVLVDEDGRFVQDYNGEFPEEYERLKTAVSDAAKTTYYGSIEHLKAKLELDEFKAKHCNQEVDPMYYITKVAYERQMLYGKSNNYEETEYPFGNEYKAFPKLYSAYMKLYYERLDILHYLSKNGSEEHKRKRLNEINQEIYNLYRPNYYVNENNELVERPSTSYYYDVDISPELNTTLELYSEEAAQTLRYFIEGIRNLENTYFKREPVHGFEHQLKVHLETIRSFEKRNAQGIPTVPRNWLEQQKAYVTARDWVRQNAKFVVEVTQDPNTGEPLSIGARIKKAFKTLSLTSGGRAREAVRIMNEHKDGEGIYDEHRIPNGSLLSNEELDKIKDAQMTLFQTQHCPPFTDRILISNAKPTNATFNAEFYAGMAINGNANPEYLKVVTELNKLLEPYYNDLDGYIHFEQIPDTEEGINTLKTIAQLYAKLRKLKKTDGDPSDSKDFIDTYVEFVTNDEILNNQIHAIQSQRKSNEFKQAFVDIAYEKDNEGNFIQRNNEFVGNRFLYSYAKPKGQPGDPNYDKFVNKTERQEALELINQVYRKAPTKYYYQALAEAQHRAETDNSFDYKEWFNQNHIYNPFTRQMEPLECWMSSEIKDELFEDNTFEGHWEPRGNQTVKKVRDGKVSKVIGGELIEFEDPSQDKRNHNYDPDKDILGNYVKGSQKGKYDNTVVLNESEKDLREYLQNILLETATVESARRYFKQNYLPKSLRPKDPTLKSSLIEGGKLFGFNISTNRGNDEWYKEIGYEFDRTPLMPMTKLLESNLTLDLQKKIKEINEREITLEQYNGNQEEFEKAIEERRKVITEYETQLKHERQSLLNRDWLNVIDAYLEQANNYNAIQENKQKLYFLLNALQNLKMYSRKYGLYGDLATDARKSGEGTVYIKEIDENLIKQYKVFLRRLLFDQWKEKEGVLTDIANNLQGFVSANYMMLNLKGGIANVTLGATGMFAEMAAREFIGPKDWAFGQEEWFTGSLGFARGGYESMFNNTNLAYNKQDAIIKFMQVVDYDETTGVVRQLSLEETSKKIRDLTFSPQTMTEHFMQNSVLFAMLHSHKLVTLDDGKTVYMNKQQYIDYKQSLLLNEVLTEQQLREYNDFKETLKKDKNLLKEYNWFRRDALTDYIYLHCNNEQINKFIKLREEQEDKFKKEFEEKTNLYDQMELGSDGTLAFKEGSDLAKLDKELADNKKTSQAIALLGAFAEKTRKVNNKIHGVYNRLGSAYIERRWFGSLIMQYHKHLPMGILKRYMARGHYNETRGTVDKGMVQSIYDVLRLNYDKIRIDAGLTEEQTNALKGFVFLIGHCFDYLNQLKTTWHIIPSYERANIWRNSGDLVGCVAAMLTVTALWAMADDDKETQDSIWFNLALYEADRLASEAFMYNPLGMFNEGKKLMSTPIAAQSIITDAMSSLKAVTDWMLDDEYDPYYHSGRFAGEAKLSVYIQRRIPMWNGIRSIWDLPSNNHYYKRGENPIGLFNIKERVTK